MADDEGVALLSADMTLPDTLDLGARVQNWSAADCCADYGQLLDVRRIVRMYLGGRNKTMIDRRGIRHGTDIGASDCRWSLTHYCCAARSVWLSHLTCALFAVGRSVLDTLIVGVVLGILREVDKRGWVS